MNPSPPAMKNRSLLLVGALALASLLGVSCNREPHPFKEERTFAGDITVTAHDLNAGYEAYMLYCYACHGEKGDGKGPASFGLRPTPRDFTKGIFKFARLRSSDELPHDDDLFRIIRGGLHGTAMLAWDIPDIELDKIVQYIKTFAPAKWEKRKKSGELVKTLEAFETPADPWGGKNEDAVKRGKELYHLRAECVTCHPAYDTKEELYNMSVAAAKRDPENFKAMGGFRDDLYGSVAKDAPAYEQKILPPDFLLHEVRSMCNISSPRCRTAGADATKTQLEDLFRLISFGVYPVMPAWKGAGLTDEDIWALAHYVKSLVDLRDTPAALQQKQRFASQPAFTVPAAAAPEKKEEATPPADGGKPAEGDKPAGDKPAGEKPAATAKPVAPKPPPTPAAEKPAVPTPAPAPAPTE
ncbi:MAG: c-type cytochrome [Polyangiaceae bacterium]